MDFNLDLVLWEEGHAYDVCYCDTEDPAFLDTLLLRKVR